MMGGGASSSKKPAPSANQQPKQSDLMQPNHFNKQQFEYDLEDDDEEEQQDQESYYTEGEMKTRIKVVNQKSYSAPYIVISDCFEEPLGGFDEEHDDMEDQMPSKAYSTTML